MKANRILDPALQSMALHCKFEKAKKAPTTTTSAKAYSSRLAQHLTPKKVFPLKKRD
jgi:hypothetical protein